jgi:hypothetical protein
VHGLVLAFNLRVCLRDLLQQALKELGRLEKNLRLCSQARIRIFCVGVKRQDAYQRKNKQQGKSECSFGFVNECQLKPKLDLILA